MIMPVYVVSWFPWTTVENVNQKNERSVNAHNNGNINNNNLIHTASTLL
jgi:hypothetical protein